MGIMAQTLRIILTWLALSVVVLLARPSVRLPIVLLAAAMLSLRLATDVPGELEVFLVAAIFALLAKDSRTSQTSLFFACAGAALTLAVYLVVCRSCVWLSSDFAFAQMGRLVSKPLDVGATYGGMDFLVLMGAFCAIWLAHTEPPRWRRAIVAYVAILAAHALYVVLLWQSFEWKERLPVVPEAEFQHPYIPPLWDWTSLAR